MSETLQQKLDRTARLVEPVFHKILNEIDGETKTTDYNGWANRSTWNVALWINNDQLLYKRALSFMEHYEHQNNPYKSFIVHNEMQTDKTPDGIKFLSASLDYKALDEMMRDLVND